MAPFLYANLTPGTFVGWDFETTTSLPNGFYNGNFTVDQSGPTDCFDTFDDNVNTHIGGSDNSNSTSSLAWDFRAESTTELPVYAHILGYFVL